MKATLMIGNSKLRAELPECDAATVLGIFCRAMMGPMEVAGTDQVTTSAGDEGENAQTPARTEDDPPAGDTAAAGTGGEGPEVPTGLFEFVCETCGKHQVVREPRWTAPGDTVQCRNCNRGTTVQYIDQAFGECKCGNAFHHFGMINGLREHVCRDCGAPVDLLPAKNGTLQSPPVNGGSPCPA